MLAGVDDDLRDALRGERTDDRSGLHEVGPRADDVCYGLRHGPLPDRPDGRRLRRGLRRSIPETGRARRRPLSRPTGPGAALRHAIADPGSALEVLRSHKMRLVVRLTDGLAPPRRRLVGRTFLALSHRAFILGGPEEPERPDAPDAGHALDRIDGGRGGVCRAGRPRAPDPAVGHDPARPGVPRDRGTWDRGGTARRPPTRGRRRPSSSSGPRSTSSSAATRQPPSERPARAELRPRDLTAATIRDRARAELTVLTPGWRPKLDAVTDRPTPVPGRVLHLLTNSLPYREAGYTVRAAAGGPLPDRRRARPADGHPGRRSRATRGSAGRRRHRSSTG